MANPTSTLNVQVQTTANLSGLQQVQQMFLSWKDAFKFAGAEEALDGVLNVVEKIGKTLLDTVNKAAELQAEAFPIKAMIDDGAKANAVIEQMDQLWQQIGVDSNTSLANAVRMLALSGTATENLIPRLIEMVKIQVGTGVSLEAMIGAYSRMKIAIENVTAPATRGFGEMAQANLALFKVLEDYFTRLEHHNVTQGELITKFKEGAVSIQQVNAALRQAAEEGGRFSHSIESFQATWVGAVTSMKTAWQGFQVDIGKPLIEWATPFINEITRVEKALAKIAEEKGWQTAILAAWTIVVDKMAEIAATVLTDIFTKIGPAAADALWVGYVSRLKNLFSGSALKEAFTGDIGKALMDVASPIDVKAFLEKFGVDLLKGVKISAEAARKLLADTLANIKAPIIIPPETPEQLEIVNAGLKAIEATLKEDEALLERIRAEQQLISSNPLISPDAKQVQLIASYRAQLDVIAKEMADLATKKTFLTDPAKVAEVDLQMGKLVNQARTLKQELFLATHPLQAELGRWAASFGDTMEQIAKTIEETVGVALQSLNTWITTGKFNLQSFMQSIEQLGLKLVEQMIIQQVMAAINAKAAAAMAAALGPTIAGEMAGAATAMTIATAGGAAIAAPGQVLTALLAIQAVLFGGSKHKGGEIERWHQGGLAEDERLIIAQTGEIMIRRDVAQENREFLLALNAGYRTASTAHLGLRDLLIARAGWGTTQHGHRGGIGGASIGGAPPGSFYGGFFGSGGGAPVMFRMRHAGGEIGTYHNGGTIGAGLGGGVHVYAFTDMNALVKHMASRSGQKIIFDTVKGNRINLGIG